MTDLLIKCENAEKIVIYGAGTISNILYFYLKFNNLSSKVKYFIVSTMGNNPSKRNGIEVIEVKDAPVSEEGVLVLVATQKIIHNEIVNTLQEYACKNYYCVDEKKLLDGLYNNFYTDSIQNNKILFINMKGMGYGCNPKYITQKLIELDTDKKLDIVWAVSDKTDEFPSEVRTVEYESLDYYHELTTAHVWVDNMRKNSDIRKREGQYYIQAWHGAAPIKKVEKDAEDVLPDYYIANAKRDSEMADLFISGSEFYTDLYRSSFWYSGEIMRTGLPRQDVFFKKEGIREKVYHYYGIDNELSMVLYAPTFRKDYSNEYYDLDIAKVVSALEKRFQSKFICAVSKHPDNRYMNYFFDRNVKCLGGERCPDLQELLEAADVLITDYSGCMYDYSVTKRPVFLYQRDYDSYLKDRNFYIPMKDLPYIKAASNEELVEKIAAFDADHFLKRLSQFMELMGNYDDGNASEKVVKRILNIIRGTNK